MAEDTGTTEAEGDEKVEPEDDAAAIAAKGKDPEAVASALRSERAKAREADKKATAALAKVKEYEDRDKTDQEKVEQRATEAEKKAQDAEARALRFEVAASKKLPAELAARLQGSTKEEMESDAEELLKLVKSEDSSATSFDSGARKSAEPAKDMSAAIRAAAGH